MVKEHSWVTASGQEVVTGEELARISQIFYFRDDVWAAVVLMVAFIVSVSLHVFMVLCLLVFF